MSYSIDPQRLTQGARQFDEHEKRKDGARVVQGLAYGLTLLRESLFSRVHQDVERLVGRDSMLVPTSEMKARDRTVEQIEIYQTAESAAAVRSFGYSTTADDWYLGWLARLRLKTDAAEGPLPELLRRYAAASADSRRLAFSDALGRVLPEARQAPLVLFRLFPCAVHLTTALAFGDHATAAGLRRQQLDLLPAIADCAECRGRPLELGEQCPACGNPLWKHHWLTATD